MDRTIRFKYRRRFPRTPALLSLLLVAVGVGTALAWLAWPSLQPKPQTVIMRPQPATGGASQVTIVGGGKIISGPLSPGEVQVVDGDTISVRGQQYRLVGFDTPETVSARCQRERDLGTRATSRFGSLSPKVDSGCSACRARVRRAQRVRTVAITGAGAER
jgi:endonuclease YncB( thermonuclease family)